MLRQLTLQPLYLVCPRQDLNLQPTDSKSGALSIELRGQAITILTSAEIAVKS